MEEYKVSPEFEKYWKALQKPNIIDEKIIKQFENIHKRIINTTKRAKKPIYSQNTKRIVRRIQIEILMHLQKELEDTNKKKEVATLEFI